MQAEIITAADGTQLAARFYEGADVSKGSVVIGGAMGVRQDYDWASDYDAAVGHAPPSRPKPCQ
ncbi:MAG TPA: hypothetical protein VLJ58_00285 [Ramlibacter sp.]|nr:hypothetical protein [Ramlibacter sp.]